MTKKQKHKQGKMREKNKLRLRHLWPRMTEAEREVICKQTLSSRMHSAGFWTRPWSQIPQDWRAQIGNATIPRCSALRIAERNA